MNQVPPSLPDQTPDPANLDQSELASNQEVMVVPMIFGTVPVKLTWISAVYNLHTKKLKAPPSGIQNFQQVTDPFGALVSQALKGNGQTTTAYYGSIAGIAAAGPADEFLGVIVNGKTIWPTDKAWADGIVDLPTLTRRRKGNKATLEFAVPHKLHHNKKFVVSGLADGSFNEATPTVILANNDLVIQYANAGPDVAKTSDLGGLVTKVVDYVIGDLARSGIQVYRCILNHSGTPDKRPPNATYWEEYGTSRGLTNPFAFSIPNYTPQSYLYWGTADQLLDTVSERILDQNGHPPYRDQIVLMLVDFLFGSERAGAPSMQVVLRRKPVQTIITGDSAELVDGQANPLAITAEVLQNPIFGLAQPDALFDADSWQEVADALAAIADKTYLSMVLDQAQTGRMFVASMIAYFDGWFRYNTAGEIEAGRFLHNEAPPEFNAATTIDYNDCIEEISWDTQGWAATFNECIVKFQDRMRAFTDAGQKAVSGWNRAVVGEPRVLKLDRPWITREDQANGHAAEWVKINAQPALKGALTVRAEKAASILQGGLFLLTHDALSLSIVCRCVERTTSQPPAGRVTVRFENERGIAPLPFRPTPVERTGTSLPHAGMISLFQFVQPPPALADSLDFQLAVLAARQSGLTEGLRLWLKKDDSSNFYALGQQLYWAVNGTLTQDYGVAAEGTTVQRSRSANVATLKVMAHGYPSGLHVNVSGLGGAGYNLNDVIVSVVDADHFSYPSVGADEGVTGDTDGSVMPLDDDDSGELQIDVDEFTVPADLDKISEDQTSDAINDNNLLVWAFKASDPTLFEIMTLRSIVLDSGVYKLSVRRARFATSQLDLETGDAVFIAFRGGLVPYTNTQFAEYAQTGTEATFRLQAFTAYEEADLSDADVCPDVNFAFADPFAPKIAWVSLKVNGTEIADFTAVFLPTDVFTFAFQLADTNADLIEGRLFARLGSVEQPLWAQSFAASAVQLKSTSFSLPIEGCWRVFAQAKDATGRVKELELAPVGGGAAVQLCIQSTDNQTGGSNQTCVTPIADPPGDDYPYQNPFYVTLSTTTAGATIYYKIVNYGVAAPVADGSGANTGGWTAYSAHFNVVLTSLGKTVYAYAHKAAFVDSAVVRNDYWKSSNL